MAEGDRDFAVDPEVAEKILATADQNLIKKVGAGGTLTDAEKRRYDAILNRTRDIDQLKQKRERALLDKWSDGKALKPAELEEIAHLLPQGGADGAEAAPEDRPARDAQKVTGVYRNKLATYAAYYESDTRTVKRWISDGKKADDYPPLDAKHEMAAWWKRHKKWRVPDIMARDAAEYGVVTVESAPAAAGPTTAPVVTGDVGYAAELKRCRVRAATAAAKLAQAEQGTDGTVIAEAEKRYRDALDTLRAFEKDADKILLAQGDTLRRDVIGPLIQQKHAAIRASLETMPTRLFEAHPELGEVISLEAFTAAHGQLLRRIFKENIVSKFGDVEQLQLVS